MTAAAATTAKGQVWLRRGRKSSLQVQRRKRLLRASQRMSDQTCTVVTARYSLGTGKDHRAVIGAAPFKQVSRTLPLSLPKVLPLRPPLQRRCR
jgi:hypothetical protein